MWAQGRNRAVGAVALALVLVGLVSIQRSSPLRAQEPAAGSPPPGALVVVLRDLGQVNAVLPSGESPVLARNLADPTGVVVLADGTVLVAERGADRVTGFGGRLGPESVPVVSVPGPTGLAVAANGSVFVTVNTPAGGEVGRIDLATRQYSALATGFGSPAGPAVRGDVLYVPDLQTGDVRSIDIATGAELVAAATGLRGPAGATSAPGLPLFVTEAAGNAIVRVDPSGGAPSPFGGFVQSPAQLALDPANPAPGSDWTLVVGTPEGIVRFDQSGALIDRQSLPSTVGVAVAPASEAVAGDATTPAATPAVVEDEDSGSDSLPWVLIVVAAAAALAVVGLIVFLVRRAGRREREDDGLMSAPPEQSPVPPVFGGCAEEEMEVDRLQELLRTVSAQLEEAQTRQRRSSELASAARHRAMRALEVRTSIQTARMTAVPPPPSEKLTWAKLSFSTDEGRLAFESFRRRELSPAQLMERFSELGETTAITQITEEGKRQLRGDPTVPWPEERQAVRDAVAARDELRGHVKVAEESQSAAVLFSEREQALATELEAARQRLDDCRRARPDSEVYGDL